MCLLTLVAQGMRRYDPLVIRSFQKILLGLAIAAASGRAQSIQITSINNSLNDVIIQNSIYGFSVESQAGGVCAGSYIDIYFNTSGFAYEDLNFQKVTFGKETMGWYSFNIDTGSSIIISAQIPFDAPVGASNLAVVIGSTTSAPFPVTISSQYCPVAQITVPISSYPFSTQGDFPFGADATYAGSPSNYYTFQSPASAGDTAFVILTGLGPTNPAVPVSTYGFSPSLTTPTVMVGTEKAQVLSCDLVGLHSPTAWDVFEVAFTVPPDLASGTYNVVISAGGVNSSTLELAVQASTGPHPPRIIAASNAASNVLEGTARNGYAGIPQTVVAPNSFSSFYISNLGSVTSPPNIFPATSYQGIQVLFNKTPVPIYNITALSNGLTLINVASPQPVSPVPANYSVTITQSSLTSDVYVIRVSPIDPGIFTIPDSANPGRRTGAIQFSGTVWDVMPTSLAAEYGLPVCTGLPATSLCGQPAKPGEKIVIYLTGAGQATPNGDSSGQSLALGEVAPVDGSVLYETVATAAVSVAGVSMTVQFSGLVPGTASLYQINATLPAQFSGAFQPGDALPLLVTLTNSAGSSSDQVAIAVSN